MIMFEVIISIVETCVMFNPLSHTHTHFQKNSSIFITFVTCVFVHDSKFLRKKEWKLFKVNVCDMIRIHLKVLSFMR